jgi:hypothetical protein
MANPLASLWQLSFQVSPIILVGGIANTLSTGLLPIIVFTEAIQFDPIAGLLTGNSIPTDLDDFFAQYVPMPGSSLVSNATGKYPSANQAVAANAIIQQPLNISMRMIAPVRETGGYFTKLAIFTALATALRQHNNSGGLYHVATPAYVYTYCIMTAMTDITEGESRQRQIEYQIDFEQPLVDAVDAATSLNAFIQRATNGSQISGNPTWSSPASTIGTSGGGSLTGTVQQFSSSTVPT